jgi:hypothetical protein
MLFVIHPVFLLGMGETTGNVNDFGASTVPVLLSIVKHLVFIVFLLLFTDSEPVCKTGSVPVPSIKCQIGTLSKI